MYVCTAVSCGFKGTVHPKIHALFTHPHVLQNHMLIFFSIMTADVLKLCSVI